jgi:hypothetical protein
MIISASVNKANHCTPRAYPVNPNNPASRELRGYLAPGDSQPAQFDAIRLGCR